MKTRWFRWGVLLLLLALLLAVALAQSGGGYDLTWNTVDGGGATFSTGGEAARLASRTPECLPAVGIPSPVASGAARWHSTASTSQWCSGTSSLHPLKPSPSPGPERGRGPTT